MRVIVEILTGNLFFIEVGTDATVGDLKKAIEEQEKLPQERLILIKAKDTEILSLKNKDGDEASLADCGVEEGSHIYLFFKLPDDKDDSTSSHSSPD